MNSPRPTSRLGWHLILFAWVVGLPLGAASCVSGGGQTPPHFELANGDIEGALLELAAVQVVYASCGALPMQETMTAVHGDQCVADASGRDPKGWCEYRFVRRWAAQPALPVRPMRCAAGGVSQRSRSLLQEVEHYAIARTLEPEFRVGYPLGRRMDTLRVRCGSDQFPAVGPPRSPDAVRPPYLSRGEALVCSALSEAWARRNLRRYWPNARLRSE